MQKFLITTLLSTGLLFSHAALAEHTAEHAPKPEEAKEYKDALSKLSPEKQALVKEAKEKTRQEFKDAQLKTKAVHDEIRTLMDNPKFDKQAYMDKVKQLEDIKMKLATDRASRIADVAAQLTPEERKMLRGAMPHKHHGEHKAAPDKE